MIAGSILGRPTAKAHGAAAAPSAASQASESAGNAALAAQQQRFDLSESESAELDRELAALDDLLMAQVKDEDEIMKKWIALI